MSETDKKNSILVCASIAAAAAGIAVVALLIKYRDGKCEEETQPRDTDHRHLKQVLSDCYDKIREIEARLPATVSTE